MIGHFPHSDVGRPALLEVTVMPSRAKPAIIGPIPSHRSPSFDIADECHKALLDPQGKSGNPDVSMNFHDPWHG
jgi:hypothetical protein